jgi:hypothetical protein
MAPSRLAQLSTLVKALGEHLQLLQESKAELLEVLRETDEMTDELRRHLEESRRILAGLAQ